MYNFAYGLIFYGEIFAGNFLQIVQKTQVLQILQPAKMSCHRVNSGE